MQPTPNMRFSNIRMVYYITGCLSGAVLSDAQEEAGHKKVQCGTKEKCSDIFGIELMAHEFINNIAKLDEYTKHGKSSMDDLLQKDLPYSLDIESVSQLVQTPYRAIDVMTIAPPTKLESNLFVKSFGKIINRTVVMQFGINTVMGDITNWMSYIFGKVCNALLRYPELNITDPKQLFLHPLEEFITSGNRDCDALYAKVEKNLDILDHAIRDHKEQITDLDYCLRLKFLIEEFLSNFYKCCKYHKQMEECNRKLHDFLHALNREFETIVSTSGGLLTQAEVRDACYNYNICNMISDINSMLESNRECLMWISLSLSRITP